LVGSEITRTINYLEMTGELKKRSKPIIILAETSLRELGNSDLNLSHSLSKRNLSMRKYSKGFGLMIGSAQKPDLLH
jgi:hypothetical protein